MDKLPNELLQLIFQHLADDDPVFVNPPRRVAEVCRLWRAQSLLLPELCATLPLVTFGKRVLPRNLGHGDLKFAISNYGPELKNRPDFCALSERPAQWAHAEFLNIHSHSFRALSSALVNKVPRLHTLKLQIPDHGGSYGGFLYAFENAPVLRHVELDCPLRMNFKIPFSQIRRYVERSDYALSIVQILQPSSLIEDISYYTDNPTPIVTAYSPSDPIPRLSSMNLHLRWCAAEFLLSPLVLPTLERLKIVSDSPTVLDAVQALLNRSGCSLRTLSITITRRSSSSEPLPEVDLKSLLEQCSDLERLELSKINRNTLDDIVRPHNLSYLPRLRELIAHLYEGPELTQNPFPSQFVPDDGRLEFVRLIFQSADQRLKAHQELEATKVTPPPRLAQPVQALEKAAKARNHDNGVLVRVFQSISGSGKRARSVVEHALSDIESYRFMSPYEVVFSRIYVPLSAMLSGSDLETGSKIRQTLDRLESAINTLPRNLRLRWKSEDRKTLFWTDQASSGDIHELINAELSYSRRSVHSPWGFVDLERQVGSS